MYLASQSPFSLSKANTQPCYSGGPTTLICKAVIDETHDSKTFVFEDEKNRSFDFKPGQYVTFRFQIGDQTHVRAYSISSTPTRPHNIQVTIKRCPDGLVSNHLNDNLKPGDRVEVADISGGFNWLDIPCDRPLFLSGGSGITPVMSMLQYITDMTLPTEAVFLHFARSPKDIIFRDQLEFLAKRFANVTVHLIVETGNDDGFDGETGRISADLIRRLVPDHASRELFVCGPEGFMAAARAVAADVTFAALHEESFGERITLEESGSTGGEVFFSLSGVNGHCGEGETLLQAALNSGIWIESSCQQGVCGSCKVLMTQGEVETRNMGGLQPDEVEQGYVLTCCSWPKGAVALDA
ncbi:hybrid-cluster NAD(P)-dependent oxidoreductase [Paracoccus seriniphilus]|uniref:Ferredoxin-NADP reductase n=2 Tax=Paracoccus seriniphilus TaxID=184748 RepID=A0A239PUW7_9RHOB|nr:hybrid-cluster NAD(P)-dependent oxidoreductase [Paracoccus seriniphilus]WCR15466.1 hybrid-cluster NAD(P)-dependent oxidoreductase [Paracoccus seriniphilus]SNT73960.1 Ferredoxin-NADP reductase [Paracoccus seriniphilus]